MNNETAATPRAMKGHVLICNCDACERLRHGFPQDWRIENTGGGCQWLRKGQIAITDGEAGLPVSGEPCTVVTLCVDGAPSELIPPKDYPSLEAALADLRAMARIYGKQ